MIEYNIEGGKLFIYDAKKSKSFLSCSVITPMEGKNTLIMMGGIRPNIQKNKKILEIIFESLKNYYQISYLKDSINNLELHFENALQKTNQELQLELIKKDEKDWLEKCSLVVCVIKENMLHFTYMGNEMEIFLIRNNKISNVLNDRAINNKINPLKIFTHITSGTLNNDDRLLFCNSSLLDYFSQEKLKKVILAYPAEKACQYLKSLLNNEIDHRTSIEAIILKNSFIEKKEKIAEEQPDVQEIKINSSPIVPRINKIKNKLSATKNSFLNGVNIFSNILNKTKSLILNSFGIFKKIKEKIIVTKIKFKFLSAYHKVILLTCLFLLLLFIQSIAFLGGKKLAEKQKNETNQLKQEIQSKQGEIEVLLSYKNEDKAEKIIQEVGALIQKLPSRTEKDKELITELKNKNDDLFNKSMNIFVVNPALTTDLSSLKEGFSPQQLLLSEQYAYTFDLKNNIFSKTDIQNKNTSLIEAQTEETLNNVVLLNKENLLFSTEKGNLFKFSLEENILSSFKLESQKEKIIKNVKIYQDKLYLLETKENQILKYQKIGESFGQETSWLKENMDFKDIISFAIDGSIYLLKEDGQVLKLRKGEKQDFNISNLKINSFKPVKIFTDLDTNFIYLLDPSNKLIVITDKNGKVEKILKCEELSKTKDLFVVEKTSSPLSSVKDAESKEKKIYLLTDNKILEINI